MKNTSRKDKYRHRQKKYNATFSTVACNANAYPIPKQIKPNIQSHIDVFFSFLSVRNSFNNRMIFIFHIRKALINDKRTNTAIYAINVPPIALKSNMTGSSFGSPSNILNTIKKSFKRSCQAQCQKY